MFEQAFKNIDDILWKEAGCTTELDYTEQSSWLLFLKYLDGLEHDLADIQEKDRYEVVLANPPFGGKERKEVQQNFPIRTGETAFLFLQHFIKMLKAGGRGGVVIKSS
jgi:type I restriction-modification system DNA methylase subunit